MRKSLVILLLLCFSVQITGYHLFFQYKKSDVRRAAKKRMRRGVDHSLTETFEFPLEPNSGSEQPVWIEDHEFTYKGEMYDVIEKKIIGDRMFVRCVNDEKEEKLMEQYKAITKKDFGERSKKRASLFVKFLSGLYSSFNRDIALHIRLSSWINEDRRSSSLAFVVNEVPTPPPQHA